MRETESEERKSGRETGRGVAAALACAVGELVRWADIALPCFMIPRKGRCKDRGKVKGQVKQQRRKKEIDR